MIPKLRAVKGWSVDDLFEVLCDTTGKDPGSLLSGKR
jgi:hypothetical protein